MPLSVSACIAEISISAEILAEILSDISAETTFSCSPVVHDGGLYRPGYENVYKKTLHETHTHKYID
jgi:hypothetical protein